MLKVIEDATTVRACQAQLKRAVVAQASESRKHVVGYPGGASDATIHYAEKLDFWMAFEQASGRYFNPCGIGYPFGTASPAPHLEINFPLSDVNRRVAGMFLEDEAGVRYVAHSGKVGGGTKGVSLTAFLAHYPAWSIALSGDQEQKVYVLGRLDDPKLVKKLAAFTRVSAEFRAQVKAGNASKSADAPMAPVAALATPPSFSPEFEGTKVYTTAERVEADCKHGTVVNALRQLLVSAGLSVGNTVNRDLYVAGAGGALAALFEVKTTADTTSVYTCIGQLLFHGGSPKGTCLAAVLPGDMTAEALARLAAIGLAVVTFDWVEDAPVFDGLDSVVEVIKGRRR